MLVIAPTPPGQRDSLPPETIDVVAELRTHTDTPICVGFGISKPETVANICRVADGTIVGSVIIRRITDHKGQPRCVSELNPPPN